nr:MAG: hypothetical protein [Caudoviricetes sp.]
MDILNILSSKPHNQHYLKRYYTFISNCCKANSLLTKEELGITENHHICPKAKDLFPEFSNFSKNKWNKIQLTPNQHYVAHWILWKVYGGSQIDAFWKMNQKQSANKTQYRKIGNKTYYLLKVEKCKKQSKLLSDLHKDPEFKKKSLEATNRNNKIRKENGEQKKLMESLWENGKLREGQINFRNSERGKQSIEQTILKIAEYKRSPEGRQVSTDTAKKSHENGAFLKTCEKCGLQLKTIYGNYSRHVKKCQGIAPTLFDD